MAVNIGSFRQSEVRKKISVINNNKEDFVVVRNAVGEQREQLLKTWEELALEGTEESSIIEFTKIVLKELTDLEIDDDVDLKEIILNPPTELSLVLHEVHEIMNEIMTQFWTSKIRQLNQSTIALLTTHTSTRTEVLLRLTEELNEATKTFGKLQKDIDNKSIVNPPIVKHKVNKNKKKN